MSSQKEVSIECHRKTKRGEKKVRGAFIVPQAEDKSTVLDRLQRWSHSGSFKNISTFHEPPLCPKRQDVFVEGTRRLWDNVFIFCGVWRMTVERIESFSAAAAEEPCRRKKSCLLIACMSLENIVSLVQSEPPEVRPRSAAVYKSRSRYYVNVTPVSRSCCLPKFVCQKLREVLLSFWGVRKSEDEHFTRLGLFHIQTASFMYQEVGSTRDEWQKKKEKPQKKKLLWLTGC